MKKVLCLLLALSMAAGLCACGSSKEAEPTEEEVAEAVETVAEASVGDPLTTNGGLVIDLDDIKKEDEETPQRGIGHYYVGEDAAEKNLPDVYFTADISPEALVATYEALGWTPTGNVAVKISTGESSESNQLDPELIADLVHKVNGTIVECNTAYGGNRSSTEDHLKAAEEHGYTAIAEVDIMDAEGTMSLPTSDKATRLEEDIVGSHFANYDSFIVLSHFKGHSMGGFGGAIKNTSIGIAAAPDGKCYIHSGGASKTEWCYAHTDPFQEAMAEAAQAVSNSLNNGQNIIYISVMNRISVDCDCVANPAEPDIHDVGILASTDPIALDQACIDLASCMDGSGPLMLRIANRHGLVSLEHGEDLGLGTRNYNLVNLDAKA